MVVFLHIAKCAGTSLAASLAEILQPQAPCPFKTDPELAGAGPLDSYDFFQGHFTMFALRKLLPDAPIVTMLRHPVTRAISQYQTWHNYVFDEAWQTHLASDGNAAEALAFTQKASINEFLHSSIPSVQKQFTNCQTYFLSDTDIEATEFAVWDEAVLRSAKHNLRTHIRQFGIAERMADSLALLAHSFGKQPVEQASLNRSRVPSEFLLNAGIVSRIESRSPMDLELYNFAATEFDRRVAGMVDR